MQRPAAWHGVASIDREIQDRELELVRINPCWRDIGISGNRKANLRSERPPQQLLDACDKARQIHRFCVQALLSRKGEERWISATPRSALCSAP